MDANTFREMLITEFNLESYSPEEQSQYLDQIGELVIQGTLIKAAAKMDESTGAGLEAIIDRDGEPQEMINYLQAAIPSFGDMIREEIAIVKQDLATPAVPEA